MLLSANALRADQTAQPTRTNIKVNADRVEYYADEQIIEARGDVTLSLSNGVTLAGDACAINLALRRVLVAGHVIARTPAGSYEGAAFAEFLSFKRSYFIPLADTPDRWTFLDDDYARPEKGREMPGDAFFFPDMSGSTPFIVGKSARIDPENYVQISPARFVFFGGGVTSPPLPAYVRNFSDNENFAVNSLAGATYDIPYGIAGSAHSLDALHLRYDQQRKSYGSVEHHSVFGSTGYAVFSVNPATQPAKQWNLLSYAGANTSAFNLNAQLFTYQYGLSQPLSSSGFVDVQRIMSLRGSSLRLELTQSYDSFLARPALGYYGDPSHPFTPNHPLVLGASWFGYDKRVGASGLTYRLVSGFSVIHDAFGVSTSGKPDASTGYLGALIYTPVYRAPLGTGANASYQAQRTWLSFPNQVDTQTLIVNDSKRFTNKFAVTATFLAQSAFMTNVNALYASPSNTTGLVPQPLSPNGLPLIGGVTTAFPAVRNNALALTTSWAPSTSLQFTLLGQINHYSPVQVPFVAGPPHYVAFGDVRTRLTRTLFIDIGRAYYFNWADQRWSPRFALQVTAQ